MSQGLPAQPPKPDPEEQAKIQAASKALHDARANITPRMNRKERRAAAKKAGVFKYPGLSRHVQYNKEGKNA